MLVSRGTAVTKTCLSSESFKGILYLREVGFLTETSHRDFIGRVDAVCSLRMGNVILALEIGGIDFFMT